MDATLAIKAVADDLERAIEPELKIHRMVRWPVNDGLRGIHGTSVLVHDSPVDLAIDLFLLFRSVAQ